VPPSNFVAGDSTMPSTGARLAVPTTGPDRHADSSSSPTRPQTAASTGPISITSIENRFGLLVLLVSAAAVAIAAVGLSRVSLWVDESYTVSVATRSLADVWRMVHTIDIVHALYNTMLHPWLRLVEVSELTVRLPSLVAVGIATAGVMVLARRLVGTEVALLAGVVFSLLPRVTWMGIEGRSYAATAAVAVWWTVLFVSLLRTPRWPKFAGYAALTVFAGSLNIFLVLLVAVHGLTLLADPHGRWRRCFWTWTVAAAVGLAGTLPVVLTASSQSDQIGPTRLGALGYLRSIAVNQWFLGDTPTTYFTGSGPLGFGGGADLWKVSAVLLAAIGWALVGYGLLTRPSVVPAPRAPDFRHLLIAWLVVPTAALVGYSLVSSGPIYNPRYLTFAAPALAVLIAIGIRGLANRTPRSKPARFALPLVAVLLVGTVLPVYASQRTPWAKSGADWSGVAGFISAHRIPAPEGVYYAPRAPGTSTGAGATTARTLEPIYPAAVAGLLDLTLETPAATEGDLTGRSLPLRSAAGRLDGLAGVFMVHRRDYPAAALAADETVFTAAGFHAEDSWSGPLNTVVEYVR
jgi:mannosyltransferase